MKAPLATAIVLSAGLAAVPALAASSSSQNMTGATPGARRVARAKHPIHERPERRGRHAYRAEDARRPTKAGFTDIRIMPSSFLVRAKDLAGNPVMMVVNPNSVTAITEENNAAGNNASASTAPNSKSTAGSQPATPGATQTKP